MIGIMDYGVGNLGSIKNMLSRIGEKDAVFLNHPEDLERVDKIILPGVGAFDQGMTLLNESGMRDALDEQVLDKNKPIIGD